MSFILVLSFQSSKYDTYRSAQKGVARFIMPKMDFTPLTLIEEVSEANSGDMRVPVWHSSNFKSPAICETLSDEQTGLPWMLVSATPVYRQLRCRPRINCTSSPVDHDCTRP